MKGYERTVKPFLETKVPVIIRLDGKAFHTFTKGLAKPFDDILVGTMQETTRMLCENIQGCKLGYTQSDEITLLLTDWEKEKTNAFFDYNLQKITSVTASMATLYFNKLFRDEVIACKEFKNLDDVDSYVSKINTAVFDSRAFNVPIEEVTNSFIWRQQDAIKNSITMVASAYFSHNQLHGVKSDEKKTMLLTKGVVFDKLPTVWKRGTCAIKTQVDGRSKWVIDKNIPVFTEDRGYVEKLLK